MTTNIYTTDFFKNLINKTDTDSTRIVKIDNDIKSKKTKDSPNLLEFIFSSQQA